MTLTNLQEAAEIYVSQGLVLVPIPQGSKAPSIKDWQKHGVNSLEQARAIFRIPHNLGLLHEGSATATLDIDDTPKAYEAFEAIGLNLDDYLNAVTPKIKSAKGIKPVFRMPKGLRLETKKLAFTYQDDGKRKAHTVFELRGAGGQDVLPPSLHPSGIYYEWVDGYPESYEDFLELPSELLNLWQKWDFYLSIMQSVSPHFKAPRIERKGTNTETLEIIEKFSTSVDIADLLESYGYQRKGKKFVAPGSSTGLAGVTILEDEGKQVAYSHHGSDPLANGHSHDAFSVLQTLGFNGDFKATMDEVRRRLGLGAFEPAKHSNQSQQATEEEKPWPERLELPDVVPDPEDMTYKLLPEALSAWVMDSAKRACVHVAFIAVIAMCAVGATVGRNLGIHPKRRDDWLELANLWAAIVAPPSNLKSHAVSEGTIHLKRLAVNATNEFKKQLATNKAKKEIFEIELATLKKEAKAEGKNPKDFQAQIQAKLEEIAALDAVTERRYIANDVTMEKAGELLVENPRGLLLLRDELVGLLKACDKSGYEAYRPFLLEAWNGKGSYSFDRIGRGTLHVPSVTLSVCGGIQPGRLRSYITGAIDEDEQADGLLQRFQLLVWFDRAKAWQRVDETPDKEARETAYRFFEFLDLKLPALSQKIGTFDEGDIPGLRFSDEAQEIFNAWLDMHMTKLRSDQLNHTPAFQAHLAKYNKLIPALALLFHLCDLGSHDAHNLTSVSPQALNLAIAWGEYLEKHARKLYALELSTELINAQTLSEKILSGELVDGQNVSHIYQRNWPGLKKVADVEAALKILEGAHWLRLEEQKNENARPTRVIRLHTDLRSKE